MSVGIPVRACNLFNHDTDETCQVSKNFFVENVIMVELKAVIQLEDVHLAQAMNYLEAYKMEIGLLINFGAKSLRFKRVHNNKLLAHDQKS
ncbi:MAG TPA: GxxExxY protein [Anaerolineales bacterium]